MIEYSEFVRLSRSSDSDERGHAAHLAALAYLDHDGPADEHAALYAALIGFLDDPSVKVRAALAYGLLHSAQAPRPIIMALLRDSAIISRAVLQYSPVLLDADLISLVAEGEPSALLAISQREKLSSRIASALIAHNNSALTLRILRRCEIALDAGLLVDLAQRLGENALMRGALLGRPDLPAPARLILVQRVTESLRQARIVRGSLAPDRLARLLRDGADTALSAIGEAEVVHARGEFVERLVGSDQLNTRILLHALTTGHVMFFAACVAELSGVSRDKVFTLLENGSRASLFALFSRAGLSAEIGRLLVQLVSYARSADLADDVAARHYVVTALTEEMIADHDSDIPPALEEAFSYLSEQNIALARKAARGVMTSFAGIAQMPMSLPPATEEAPMALPAA